jgi:hypothetical protein
MSLATAIDELLAFFQDKRPPECLFLLRDEVLKRFDELDRKVWVLAHKLGLEAHLPKQDQSWLRSSRHKSYRGKTNLPGVIHRGFHVEPAYSPQLQQWRNELLALRDLAAASNSDQGGAGQGERADRAGDRESDKAKGKTGKRGRKPDTDPEADERVADAMATRHHRTYEDCGIALGMTKKEVKEAIDRHRHRAKGKRRRPSQAPE